LVKRVDQPVITANAKTTSGPDSNQLGYIVDDASLFGESFKCVTDNFNEERRKN
jgi:hypothetical protein